MSKKKKRKEAWEIVLKDRFLTNEKPDNPYVMALLYFVVFLLSFLLIFVCFFQLCEIKGDSMLTTLHNGDHVLLLKTATDYKRGDIVVITKTKSDGTKTNIVKRVIAIGGDTLQFRPLGTSPDSEVQLYRKKSKETEFSLVDESGYVRDNSMKKGSFPGNFKFNTDIAIDDGFLYVMGDNRNRSEDSRHNEYPFSLKEVYSKSVLTIKRGSLLEKLLTFLYHENNAADKLVRFA